MKKELLQLTAEEFVARLEKIAEQPPTMAAELRPNLAAIGQALEMARSNVANIECCQQLLYLFFFPLCKQLDAVFYDQSYKRGLFGSCSVQSKIVSSINNFWKIINRLVFEDADQDVKNKLFLENISTCEHLFEKREGKKIPDFAQKMLAESYELFCNGTTYGQLCRYFKEKTMTSNFQEKKVYLFLSKFFSNHPPIIGRQRKKINLDAFTAYVDVWSPAQSPHTKILYLHGWHDSPDSVKLLAQLAIEAGFEVHAIHLPGHGLDFSTEYISISTLQQHFLLYYFHLLKEDSLPILVAGHSMGGAILASCLNVISSDQLQKIVFFAPAFSAKQIDLLQEKMPLVHKNRNPILAADSRNNLLRGGKGPVNPVIGMLSTFFIEQGDNLYTLMQQGYQQLTTLEELPAKMLLIYGKRDHCINYNVLKSVENRAEVVIRHQEFDHGPHVFPVCGGTIVVDSVLNSLVHRTL